MKQERLFVTRHLKFVNGHWIKKIKDAGTGKIIFFGVWSARKVRDGRK